MIYSRLPERRYAIANGPGGYVSRNILIFKDCKKFVVKGRMLYKP